jgi:hypothetical protein
MNTKTTIKRVLGIAAMSAIAIGFATPAHASPAPPKADTALLGTWVNTNAASNSVKQIVVAPNRVNSVNVDAFGACSPTLCEWGSVPAITYGSSVSSLTGTAFQTNQRFLSGGIEWSRTSLQGNVVNTSLGARLVVREMTVFEDGSGRKNYTRTEVFQHGKGLSVTKLGSPVSTYPLGKAPALTWAAFGSWTAPTPNGGLVSLKISGTPAAPVVTTAGQCSPTPCSWGSVRGITYGASISSTVGGTVLAPFTFGFKHAQLVITYSTLSTGQPALRVQVYNEFTDGSGRSNYVLGENFVRV